MEDTIFRVPANQLEKLDAWKKEQKKKIIGIRDRQKDPSNMFKLPHDKVYGSWDNFTYMFTQTGIGVVVKVVNNFTKDELDISDYEHW